MITWLRFDTSDPDQKLEYLRTLAVHGLCAVIGELGEWLRTQTKYGGKDYSAVRERLAELLEENNVNLDELQR